VMPNGPAQLAIMRNVRWTVALKVVVIWSYTSVNALMGSEVGHLDIPQYD